MRLSRLRISNLRSIRTLEIAPSDGLNVIWGANGSGKTTILEGIYLLHSGKSFRTPRVPDLISRGEKQLGVLGEIDTRVGDGQPKTIKLQKTSRMSAVQIDNTPISSASVLAKTLPALLIEPNSFAIIEGAPKVRRSLVDRASFHVEPSFLTHSRNYMNALQQRNRLLKCQPRPEELVFWDDELAKYGEAVHLSRLRCIGALNAKLGESSSDVFSLGPITLKYRRGWNENLPLIEALKLNIPLQVAAGTTLVGPHKAEIEISARDGHLARIASRGQVKTVVISLVSAMANYIEEQVGVAPLVLVDDFAAELDNAKRLLAFKMLERLSSQVFITSIEDLSSCFVTARGIKSFHVEQGAIATPSTVGNY